MNYKYLGSNNALFRSKTSYQSGAVLIVSLIMLLLLTLIGTTSMQSTSLEEKMAGNIRDENLAFQAAETALRAGEAIVAINPPSFSVGGNGTGGTGLYTTVGNGAQASGYWQTVDWSSNTAVATYTGGSLNHINSAPRYIIEELPSTTVTGSTSNTGGSLESGTAGTSQTVSWYRITARGTGGSDNSVVMVQSIYKR
ncbi:MAG: pilus assembly PilX family protein [Methylobacter sp.]